MCKRLQQLPVTGHMCSAAAVLRTCEGVCISNIVHHTRSVCGRLLHAVCSCSRYASSCPVLCTLSCTPVKGYALASIVEMYSTPDLSLLVVRMLYHLLRIGQRW